jgi:trehalose 6-phosphate synthase/phosphatase
MAQSRRVLIVSNRLPFSARVERHGVTLAPAAGGLASGVRSLHDSHESVCIGWPGDVSSFPRHHRAAFDAELRGRDIVPVYLRRTESQAYYDGFCNGVLWPLFHYAIDRVPLEDGDASWAMYRRINERFADAVVKEYRPGDLVWVHDYHLLLVPGLLRARLPEAEIGFFLHVPFPAVDVFRTLPWRREILEGLLGSTLIGFHTEAYASHFRDAVRTLTALEIDRGAIVANDRAVRVGAYPMGVDASWFARTSEEPAIVQEAATLRGVPPRRLLLGVDRLDYTKGIPNRLLAYERLLHDRPDLRGQVQLVQIAVPSRGDTPCYQQFRQQVEELIGRINGSLGTMTWSPIRYLHQSVTPAQLVALYRAADAMLVTPLRDGMNLVAKEFIASRTDEDGVLVLSEFAGAAGAFPEAVSVNPYAIGEMAGAIVRALTMDRAERRRRMHALRRRVVARDVDWWASTFLHDLEAAATPERGIVAPFHQWSGEPDMVARPRAAAAGARAVRFTMPS